jgi:hypothetical protein
VDARLEVTLDGREDVEDRIARGQNSGDEEVRGSRLDIVANVDGEDLAVDVTAVGTRAGVSRQEELRQHEVAKRARYRACFEANAEFAFKPAAIASSGLMREGARKSMFPVLRPFWAF